MNRVWVDRNKNRLYLKLTSGGRAELKLLRRVLENTYRDLKSGFSCLADISDYDPIDKEKEDWLVQAQVSLWKAGMGKVVRVRRSKALVGYLDLDKASLSTGYTESMVESLVEAEEVLDSDTDADFLA